MSNWDIIVSRNRLVEKQAEVEEELRKNLEELNWYELEDFEFDEIFFRTKRLNDEVKLLIAKQKAAKKA